MLIKLWKTIKTKSALNKRKKYHKSILSRTSTIRISSQSSSNKIPVSIEPNGYRNIIFENFSKGDYVFKLGCEDEYIYNNPQGISLIIDNSVFDHSYDDQKELEYSLESIIEDRKFNIIFKLPLDTDRRWFHLRLVSHVDRYININSLCCQPDLIDFQSGARDIAPYVNKVIMQRPELREVEFIIFADINLNVVDGSSIWLSSMISILAGQRKTLVIAKKDVTSDIIWSNVQNPHNVICLSPSDFHVPDQNITSIAGIALLRQLDASLPRLRRVVVRGLQAAFLLCQDRQFYDRSAIYLTDFYEQKAGKTIISEEQATAVQTIVVQAGYLLTQTSAVEHKLRDISGIAFESHRLPPPIPDNLPLIPSRKPHERTVKIGYAGKVTSNWGVDELLDWTGELELDGLNIEKHIVANRISDGVGLKNVPGYGERIREKMERSGSRHYDNYNRRQSMTLMAEMDFVWCYRPAEFEENTLELSTKLVEMAAAGAACLCYPNKINIELLGEDYPYFIKSSEDLRRLLQTEKLPASAKLIKQIRETHSLSKISDRLAHDVFGPDTIRDNRKTVVFAGHDFKFLDAYISHLKAQGFPVLKDKWEWGEPVDLAATQRLQQMADIIFCEWGLANTVWHSKNKRPGTKLFVRIHLQEINERAQKFGYQIESEAVDCFIFVEENVRQKAIELFDFPEQKTCLIPNFLLDDEYRDFSSEKHNDDAITLGMVGIVPQRKRFDRAVAVLSELVEDGLNAHLQIKGPRPESLAFMNAPGRVRELDYYQGIYKQIEADPRLQGRVIFSPWGNDVANWYRKVDFILSPSDFESFHYALADGILSGCAPLIWPWEGASEIYHSDWLLSDSKDAILKIKHTRRLSKGMRVTEAGKKRSFLVERYGREEIFARLSEVIYSDVIEGPVISAL